MCLERAGQILGIPMPPLPCASPVAVPGCSLYNVPVYIRKVFFVRSLVCSRELSNLRGILGSPVFVADLVEVWGALGQFCKTKPFNWWSLTTLGRVRTELNCWTRSYCQRIGELSWETDTYLVSGKKKDIAATTAWS